MLLISGGRDGQQQPLVPRLADGGPYFGLVYEDVDKLTKVGKGIRDKIMDNPLPENFETRLIGYHHLAPAVHFAAEFSAGINVKGLATDAFTTFVDALVYHIDLDSEEMMIAYPNLLFDRNIFDGHGMMCSFLALISGNYLIALAFDCGGTGKGGRSGVAALRSPPAGPARDAYYDIVGRCRTVSDICALDFQFFMNLLWSFLYTFSVRVFIYHPESHRPNGRFTGYGYFMLTCTGLVAACRQTSSRSTSYCPCCSTSLWA